MNPLNENKAIQLSIQSNSDLSMGLEDMPWEIIVEITKHMIPEARLNLACTSKTMLRILMAQDYHFELAVSDYRKH